MSRIQVKQLALAHSESGLHCAESVASAITQLFCPEQTEIACRMATGFGGGLAGSRQEACGALTGGVLAIGLLCGRTTPEQGRETAYRISAAYRERFIARFDASICQTLRDSFSTDDTRTACRSLTAEAAGMLYDILQEHGYLLKTA
ncbi:C_GCAxxG_C_C family probable redox protein [Trichlorobacter thiogenes]|uniref:C_GCAxxG_C_C family probable redox protein n=1 Tax=Trichlorobacter thiogenes TaxID=115783 RepID=A0A1T4K6C9_9BACT|nr:C-GCAxxG-C-C family protein [Trichlorobacter thiogenes]SJZ37887.1 C_GCAxxG_C_C family probable redox protein [Trichlorobacter thiogenes]